MRKNLRKYKTVLEVVGRCTVMDLLRLHVLLSFSGEIELAWRHFQIDQLHMRCVYLGRRFRAVVCGHLK